MEDKSVQLDRGSFLSKYFLQNPYFSPGFEISGTRFESEEAAGRGRKRLLILVTR